MNLFRFVFFFLVIWASAFGAATPPHPTLVYAEYKKEKLPVVGADKDRPIVVVDGKRVTLPANTPLSTERASGFVGRAQVTHFTTVKSEPRYEKKDNGPGYLKSASWEKNTVDVSADQDLQDCFLLITAFDEDFITTPDSASNPSILVWGIPDLKAKTSVTEQFERNIMITRRYTHLPQAIAPTFLVLSVVQLFSQGQEVRLPPDSKELTARFYHEREIRLHAALLKEWIHAAGGQNRPLQPFLQIPPLLEPGQPLPAKGSALITISPAGTVSELKLEGDYAPETAEALRTALSAWLFFPKLAAGKPQAATVRLPLNF